MMSIWTGARAVLMGSCAALIAGQAFAAGFEVKERSVTAQGAANAGASASAQDISQMYFNPATIGFHEGTNASLGLNLILPNAETSGGNGLTRFGTPISGGDEATNTLALVPATYLSTQLTEEITIGVGVTAPFGLTTEYDDEWVGRYHAIRSALTVINVSPTVAYRPIPEISIAGGPVIEYVDAELTQAVDGGAAVGNPAISGGAAGGIGDGKAKLEGDDIAYGFALGVIVEPISGTRIGAAFRSAIEHNVKLDASFRYDAAGAMAGANAGFGVFNNGGAHTSVSAPAQVNLGISHQINDQWTVMGDAQWTQWSSFDSLVINFDDNTPTSVVTTDWDDTWFLSLGAQYQANESWTLRAGVAYDTAAVQSDEFRGPRIPDSDRIWGAFGATYELSENISLTGAYTYVYVDDSTINIAGGGENATRGSLNANVDADVHIISLGGSYKF